MSACPIRAKITPLVSTMSMVICANVRKDLKVGQIYAKMRPIHTKYIILKLTLVKKTT